MSEECSRQDVLDRKKPRALGMLNKSAGFACSRIGAASSSFALGGSTPGASAKPTNPTH